MVNYLSKEVEKVYQFSTISEDRSGLKEVKINGRNYFKQGTFQAVTLVGVLYNVYDPSVKHYKKMLHVGVSKQHPSDISINKRLAYEDAHTKALMEPVCVMEVGNDWRQYNFTQFARNYVSTMKLQFVKTAQELALNNVDALVS